MIEKNTSDRFDGLGEATGLNVISNGRNLRLSSEADAFVSAEYETRQMLDFVDMMKSAGMPCPPDLGSSWSEVAQKTSDTLKKYCEFNGTTP